MGRPYNMVRHGAVQIVPDVGAGPARPWLVSWRYTEFMVLIMAAGDPWVAPDMVVRVKPRTKVFISLGVLTVCQGPNTLS